MHKNLSKHRLFFHGAILTASALMVVAMAWGQSKPLSAFFDTRTDLTAQELRGKGVFLQRCSLCHLPQGKRLRAEPPKPYAPEFRLLAPSLEGILRDATPERMNSTRTIILKGQKMMPGFEYGLVPQAVDDLMAYLKRL